MKTKLIAFFILLSLGTKAQIANEQFDLAKIPVQEEKIVYTLVGEVKNAKQSDLHEKIASLIKDHVDNSTKDLVVNDTHAGKIVANFTRLYVTMVYGIPTKGDVLFNLETTVKNNKYSVQITNLKTLPGKYGSTTYETRLQEIFRLKKAKELSREDKLIWDIYHLEFQEVDTYMKALMQQIKVAADSLVK